MIKARLEIGCMDIWIKHLLNEVMYDNYYGL